MGMARFTDRREAGRKLAQALAQYAGRDDVVVLGLPRGGVPVAYEVAKALNAPLDVFIVRKLGVPDNEELAFGAVASGGVRVVDTRMIERLGIPDDWVEAVDQRERREIERRERAYRGDHPPVDVSGNTVIVVDDGLATGASMLAALHALRAQRPARIVAAVPVAPKETCEDLRSIADEVVCLMTPDDFHAVGQWYDDFSQTGDQDVRDLLERARFPEDVEPPFDIKPVTGAALDYDLLIDRAASARFVCLGEASHGTHEFYRERAEITKRLIADHGFTAIAVEADWPDAYRVNCYVRGAGDDESAEEALGDFERFPRWMWRNTVVADFVEWLREWNQGLPEGAAKTGFYGLDLYSLYTSMEKVVEYLEEIDPEAAQRARERYSCFDHFSRDPQVYSYETGIGGAEPCERQAVEQLMELREMAAEVSRDSGAEVDRHFYAAQNARLVANAEEYYREAFRGGVRSWNLRDTHMAETLDELVAHMELRQGTPVKAALWAHNSHLGDARATELGQSGELNLGQLVRERRGDESLLVGFTTFTGTVTCASDWGGPAERKRVLRGLAGSWERRLHEQEVPNFLVVTTAGQDRRRLERAIGVIYRPETERFSHYFHARLADQFDCLVHLDKTTALEPLPIPEAAAVGRELPDTYPWGV
jgi:erythromycin esterase-like protein/pyrimidine operon attenuation protein/uracil phosphoribosyltransferase